MAFVYTGQNRRSFSAVCGNNFGRKIYTTRYNSIDSSNILEELGRALAIHRQNAVEIEYLDGYYKGDHPILYRKKVVRPEVNNKIVINLAYELVERKVAEMCAEPIQYVLRGTDETKASQITELNVIMDSEDKQDVDVDIFRWRSICGTAYRFIGNDEGNGSLLDESDFEIQSLDPRYTFVAYYTNKKPAFSCTISKNVGNITEYFVYTRSEWFITDGREILNRGVNGNGAIPVIEYPNNARRLSDIEITISITDAIDVLQSDRINGVEQFVSSWVKFVNCEVDKENFLSMRQEGALVVKSNNGENKADVDVMTTELNQSEGQVVFTDLFERFLSIQGLANREKNTGGDTGSAVSLRNGHFDSQLRAEINEPIVRKSERMMLKIVLNRLRITRSFSILPSDIEIHINHNKLDNLLVKSEALEILLRSGINYRRAIKTVGLFNDPELVANESAEYMESLYAPTTEADTDTDNDVNDANVNQNQENKKTLEVIENGKPTEE